MDSHKDEGMGMTYLNVGISKTRKGPRKTVRMLVDTGAFPSILPAEILEVLGVEPEERRELRIANGKSMHRRVGRLYVHHGGRSAETFVVFGRPGDAILLGSYALEGLELEVDPKSRRVRRMKALPVYGAVSA